MSIRRTSPDGDLRVRRTRKRLWEALMALLADRDFAALTVNDICARAMVHRTTFYNHFADKFDLLDNGLKDMFEDLRAGFVPPHEVFQTYDPGRPPAAFVALFEHILEHRPFYAAMFKGGGIPLFRDRVRAYLVKASRQRLKLLEAERGPALVPIDLVAHVDTGAIFDAVAWWARQGFRPKPVEFARHVALLLGYGTFGAFPGKARQQPA